MQNWKISASHNPAPLSGSCGTYSSQTSRKTLVHIRLLLYASLFVLSQGLLAVLFPTSGKAYEAFAGFQIDNEQQYFSYAGLRATLNRPTWFAEPFLQLFAFRQRFFFRSEGQLLEGQLNQLTPAVGLNKTINGLTLQVSAGPALRLTQEETASTDEEGAVTREKETIRKVGYDLSAYTSYSTDGETFEGVFSYTNLSNFFFGRLRWLHYEFETPQGIPVNPGLELSASGNSDFKESSVGGLLGTEIGKIEILLKGGYQNNSTFHGGGYGGIELYVRF